MRIPKFCDEPRISVVTIVKNDIPGLEHTRFSVADQKYISLQHIIVAGSSTDGTLELARRWGDAGIVNVYGDQDAGIYDAMNKGLFLARAPWVWFLNAGDSFCTEMSARDAINSVGDSSWAFGAVIPTDSTGERVGSSLLPHITRRELQWGDVYLNHQALLMKSDFLREIGAFDASFQSAGEFDMYLRALEHELPRRIPDEWVNYLVGGTSMTNTRQHLQEIRRSRNLRLNLSTVKVTLNAALTRYRIFRNELGSRHYPVIGSVRSSYLDRKYGL